MGEDSDGKTGPVTIKHLESVGKQKPSYIIRVPLKLYTRKQMEMRTGARRQPASPPSHHKLLQINEIRGGDGASAGAFVSLLAQVQVD
eukprot:scaffold151239_cov26-Prasinocladus_malaysianus.AAC.1